MKTDLRVAYTTMPDLASAESLAEQLVAKKIAACVNLIPGVISHYCWEGQATRSQEIILLIKTTVDCWSALTDFIHSHHPYDTPALWAIDPTQTDCRFLAWINESVVME